MSNNNEKWRINCLKPTKEITKEQYIWLIKHTIICSIVCCGVNFGISYLSFHGEDSPTLWYFPTPISGSFAVTLGLELTLNWIINCPLMTFEIINGKVAPLDPKVFKWWPTSKSTLWWLNGSELVLLNDNDNHNHNDNINNNLIENKEQQTFCKRLNNHLIRAFPWGISSFFLTWPVSVFICWIVWGNYGYNDYPLPELLIAIYGIFLVFVTLPFWGIMILIDLGSRIQNQPSDSLNVSLKYDINSHP